MLASLRLIDQLDRDIDRAERELRALGADHRYIPRLMSCPGIGWVLGYTVASEIGDITRFGSPTKLVSYTGLIPRVHQSGQTDRRGPLTKHGPRYLRSRAHRGRAHGLPARRLPSRPPAHGGPPGSRTRPQGGRHHHRPQAGRGHLAHAHARPALCSGRRRLSSDRLTVLL